MSTIRESNIGFGGLPIHDEDQSPKVNTPTTDDIASGYRKRIMQSISSKLFKFNNTLVPPVFTQEELAFIKKDAEENDPASEVKVITPDPTITLKKGNTEINIRNAATLVKKMEQIYPNPNKSSQFGVESDEDESFVAPAPIIPTKPEIKSDIKTVNKNAYEIRTDILAMALDWVKFKTTDNRSIPSDEDVLTTAQKFYRFVENRR